METTTKIKYFEYFVHRLYNMQSNGDANDLSTLKVLKLLFFTAAVRSNLEASETLLENVFDKFVAMPYGPVESDVYNWLTENNGRMTYYEIRRTSTFKISQDDLSDGIVSVDLESRFVKEIDNSIEALRKVNNLILNENAFNLVEISHAWHSWKKNYYIAKEENRRSGDIPKIDILNEDKIYNLQIF